MHYLAFLSLLPLATAIIGAGPGPSDNGTFWDQQNQSPNATGSFPLLGVNMTADPNVAIIPELWTASINVTSVRNAPNTNASLAIINSVISLNSHGAFVDNSLWDTCVVVMMAGVTRSATVRGQKDNGTCAEAFGTNCTADWENAVLRARTAAGVQGNSTSACGGMTLPVVPDSCKDSFELSAFSNSISHANRTTGSAFYFEQNAPHDPANTTYYETAATQIWPILLIQTPGQRYPNSSSSIGGFASSRMSCLRAKNATAGSLPIGDVPGAGSKMEISIWGLVAAMTAMFTLM